MITLQQCIDVYNSGNYKISVELFKNCLMSNISNISNKIEITKTETNMYVICMYLCILGEYDYMDKNISSLFILNKFSDLFHDLLKNNDSNALILSAIFYLQ